MDKTNEVLQKSLSLSLKNTLTASISSKPAVAPSAAVSACFSPLDLSPFAWSFPSSHVYFL